MKKELLKTVLPYGIAIVLLLIGSLYDYQITNALHGRLPYSGVDLYKRQAMSLLLQQLFSRKIKKAFSLLWIVQFM